MRGYINKKLILAEYSIQSKNYNAHLLLFWVIFICSLKEKIDLLLASQSEGRRTMLNREMSDVLQCWWVWRCKGKKWRSVESQGNAMTFTPAPVISCDNDMLCRSCHIINCAKRIRNLNLPVLMNISNSHVSLMNNSSLFVYTWTIISFSIYIIIYSRLN